MVHQAPGEAAKPDASSQSTPGIVVVDQWTIDGLAARYETLDSNAPAETIASELRSHAVEAQIPLPAGRGVAEGFAWVINILKNRQLIADLGEQPAAIDWLSLHVPPGGSASFHIQNSSKEKGGVSLRLLGTGFGSGVGVSLSVKEDFLERTRCARLSQHVNVRVRRFGTGSGAEEIETSVTAIRHMEVKPWDPCPMCGRRPDELDPFSYVQASGGIDLTHDDVGMKRSETIELSASYQADIGLEATIPGLGVAGKIGISAGRDLELTCSMDYAFPPKSFFTPYRASGTQVVDLPFWAVTT